MSTASLNSSGCLQGHGPEGGQAPVPHHPRGGRKRHIARHLWPGKPLLQLSSLPEIFSYTVPVTQKHEIEMNLRTL